MRRILKVTLWTITGVIGICVLSFGALMLDMAYFKNGVSEFCDGIKPGTDKLLVLDLSKNQGAKKVLLVQKEKGIRGVVNLQKAVSDDIPLNVDLVVQFYRNFEYGQCTFHIVDGKVESTEVRLGH